jgi:hypothetical protein
MGEIATFHRIALKELHPKVLIEPALNIKVVLSGASAGYVH